MSNEKLPYRFSGKRVLLTYTGDFLSIDSVFNRLSAKLHSYCILDYLVVLEHNPTHIHAYIECKKKIDTTNKLFFDLWYDKPVHPNVKCVSKSNLNNSDSSRENVIDYLLKFIYSVKDNEGINYLISPNFKNFVGPYGNYINVRTVAIQLAQKGNVSEALHLLLEEIPEEAFNNYGNIKLALQDVSTRSLNNVNKTSNYLDKSHELDLSAQKALSKFLQNDFNAPILLIRKEYDNINLEQIEQFLKQHYVEYTVLHDLQSLAIVPIHSKLVIFNNIEWDDNFSLNSVKKLFTGTSGFVECKGNIFELRPNLLRICFTDKNFPRKFSHLVRSYKFNKLSNKDLL
jgi:hypothetical protein